MAKVHWVFLGWLAGTAVLGAMAGVHSEPRIKVHAVPRQAQPVGQVESQSVIDPERLFHHIPDPEMERQAVEGARIRGDRARQDYQARLLKRLEAIRRPVQAHLSLQDALHRAIEHSYPIDVARYNPAIDQTRVIEAQAAFDAVLFSNLTKQIQDRPTGSQLAASQFDLLNWETGIRKLLPTGMTVSTSYSIRRTFTNLSFQQINPEYFNQLNIGFRQPLLRGFGLDFNRSSIIIGQNNLHISDLRFHRQVRDTLRQIEVTYWQLVQARRDVVITARVLEEFESIYRYLEARADFDVTKIQLENTKANLENSRADFIRVVSAVRILEKQLLQQINDPELNQADDIEIIPDDFPIFAPIVFDRIGELQTALRSRPEVQEAQLAIANAQVGVGQAKNQVLPRVDLSFNYIVDGLGVSQDRAFDEVTKHDFTEYIVGVEVEIPIGNRAARSQYRRAQLTLQQAQAALRQQIEQVMLDVNTAIRQIEGFVAVLAPRFESVEAGERQVEAIVERAERKDFTQLNAELNARNALANSRRQLMQAMVDYNTAILDLERAKGTLLRYDGVQIDLGDRN